MNPRLTQWSGCLSFALSLCLLTASGHAVAQEVTHRFLACGAKTYIVVADGKVSWAYPSRTRDGYVLADGRIVLTLSKSKDHPGGAAVELKLDGSQSVIWEGTQSEVNSAHPTSNNTYVVTEAGPKPRLLEVDQAGKVLVEFPLICQKPNHHLQTRMARKLSDGTYLVPHLLDFAVKQYSAAGDVLQAFDTTVPGDEQHSIHTWPFTAIRHGENQTLVCCTNGNRVLDFDASGRVIWQLTNDDLPGPLLQDPCGGQVLPNGNVVIASYGQRDPQAPKLIEVDRNKKVVWTYTDSTSPTIHHFQILTVNNQAIIDSAMK